MTLSSIYIGKYFLTSQKFVNYGNNLLQFAFNQILQLKKHKFSLFFDVD